MFLRLTLMFLLGKRWTEITWQIKGMMVARAKKTTILLYQISMRDTIVQDFYEGWYCTSLLPMG